MSRFFLLYERWERADAAAWRAESVVSRFLDLYCEGTGRAPSLEEIAEARRLRAAAREAFRALSGCIDLERQQLPVL